MEDESETIIFNFYIFQGSSIEAISWNEKITWLIKIDKHFLSVPLRIHKDWLWLPSHMYILFVPRFGFELWISLEQLIAESEMVGQGGEVARWQGGAMVASLVVRRCRNFECRVQQSLQAPELIFFELLLLLPTAGWASCCCLVVFSFFFNYILQHNNNNNYNGAGQQQIAICHGGKPVSKAKKKTNKKRRRTPRPNQKLVQMPWFGFGLRVSATDGVLHCMSCTSCPSLFHNLLHFFCHHS